jgi:hypothetical protein
MADAYFAASLARCLPNMSSSTQAHEPVLPLRTARPAPRFFGPALLLLCTLTPCAFSAQAEPKVPVTVNDVEQKIEKGDIEVFVKVTGISTAQDSYDVFSPFDGRIEDVQVELFGLVGPNDIMARLVSTEMAALLDSSSAGNKSQMEKRWKGEYDYYPIKPEFPGIVTNIYAPARTKVYKGDRLFTVAKKVVVVGKNLDRLYSPLAPGMTAELTYGKDDSLKFEATLLNFLPLKDDPDFSRLWLEADGLQRGIRIGEQFNGRLLVGRSENTLIVPKKTLFKETPPKTPSLKEAPPKKADRQYLILEVETGLETEDRIEILKPGMHFIDPENFEIKRKDKPDGKTKKAD